MAFARMSLKAFLAPATASRTLSAVATATSRKAAAPTAVFLMNGSLCGEKSPHATEMKTSFDRLPVCRNNFAISASEPPAMDGMIPLRYSRHAELSVTYCPDTDRMAYSIQRGDAHWRQMERALLMNPLFCSLLRDGVDYVAGQAASKPGQPLKMNVNVEQYRQLALPGQPIDRRSMSRKRQNASGERSFSVSSTIVNKRNVHSMEDSKNNSRYMSADGRRVGFMDMIDFEITLVKQE